MTTAGNTNWRAPKAFQWRKVIIPILLVALVAATAGVTWVLTRTDPPPPPPPPTVPTEHPLSQLEIAGITTLLARQRSGAHKASGTIVVNGHTFGVQLTYLDDNTAGSGVVTAGGTRGDALLDQGTVYLRGDTDFWSALGVTGTPPPPPGWVNIGDLLQGKLFYPPAKWTAALAPTPAARLDGSRYTVGPNSATITNASDITHYSVNDVDVDVTAAQPPDVLAAATQLGADHGPGAPLSRTAAGGWTLTAPAPPAPPAGTPTTAGSSPATPTP